MKTLVSFLVIAFAWSSEALVMIDLEVRGGSPWQVAIYQDYKYLCGGTILTKNIVISAARCFAVDNYGKFENLISFRIVAGKLWREFDDKEKTAQIRRIKKLIPHEDYKGRNNSNKKNIALAILHQDLDLNEYVKPASLDFSIFDDGKISKDALGKVVGWGGVPGSYDGISGNLTKLLVPIIDTEACREKLKLTYEDSELTEERICAGYLNDTTECVTDDGAGFIFPYEKDGKTEYYLRGIFKAESITFMKRDCKTKGIIFFTDIMHFKEFIIDNLDSNK